MPNIANRNWDFFIKNWAAREGTGLNKFVIGEKDANGKQVITNSPDSVTVQGDVLNVTELNKLENAIYTATKRKYLAFSDYTNITFSSSAVVDDANHGVLFPQERTYLYQEGMFVRMKLTDALINISTTSSSIYRIADFFNFTETMTINGTVVQTGWKRTEMTGISGQTRIVGGNATIRIGADAVPAVIVIRRGNVSTSTPGIYISFETAPASSATIDRILYCPELVIPCMWLGLLPPFLDGTRQLA